MRDMIAALPTSQGYSTSKGIIPARRAIVDAIILLAMVAVILMHARRNPVDASNVNDDWDADAETVDSSLQAHEKVAAGVTTGNAPGAANAAHGVINDAYSAAHTTTIKGK